MGKIAISQLFHNSLLLFYPDGIKYENILLFVTDAAPYMVKAADGLKVTFPKMIHLTCLVHGFHRVSEKIRQSFMQVDKLVSNIKSIFTKAPSRINFFKQVAPSLSLPPEPIITRWGTWLNAVNYYSNNFDIIKNIINSFDSNEAAAIRKSKQLINDSNVKENLVYISTNFMNLSETINKLE